MKKILFLLLCTVSIYGQTYPTNPTAFGKISINTNIEDNSITKMSVQSSDNRINWLQPINIPIPIVPTNYAPTSATLGGHLDGINIKLGALSGTTAGISTRVWFTADQTTITAGTFDLTNPSNKGTVASHQQTVANDDGQKKYFTTDLIGQPFAMATTFPLGLYVGNLSASTTPTNANQKFTVELYKCNNVGTPIASGVTGAPVGSLGVTVIMIMDSGEVTLANASVTNIPVSTTLTGSSFNIAVGERIRYHVSAEKVGTAGGVINESVYYGNSYNSFIDVPVIYNSSSIKDVSTVTNGSGTVTDALNSLKTLSDGKLDENYVNNGYVAQNPPASLTSVLYESFPLMVRGQSNKMFLFYRQGADHATSKGVIQMRTSTDGGGNWSSASTIISDASLDCRNVSGGVTPTGRIILFFMKYTFGTSLSASQGYVYSDDEGGTWSTYATIPNGTHTFYSPYGNLISIGDGKLMANWYGETPATPTYSSYVITSSDNGATWSTANAVATSASIRYGEASYAYLDGGIITGMIRNSVGSPLYQVLSTNNGNSWTNQGQVSFDSGTQVSPYLSTHIDSNNQKYVSVFYANRSDNKLRVSWADYSTAIAGTSNWNPRIDLATHTSTDFGYPTVIKSRENNNFLLAYYKAASTSLAAINFTNYIPNYGNISVTGTISSSGSITSSSNVNATTGSLNGKEINATNFFTIKGVQTSFPLTGDGFEIYNQSGVGIIQTYDRTGAVYNQLNFRGSFLTWNIGASEKMRLHASGGFSVGNTIDPGAGNVTANAIDTNTTKITITTSVSITTATTDANGIRQDGRHVVISNGVNAINITCNGGVTTSYGKVGTGAITFVQGSGRTLVQLSGTAVFNGIAGSTATLWSNGTTDYLVINNY